MCCGEEEERKKMNTFEIFMFDFLDRVKYQNI